MAVFGWLGAGLILLAFGGDLLVRGSARLAAIFGISPLIIGLTIVAFGTSSPELAVSIQASLSGQPDIALGNVVGSNILNVLLILGACAVLLPLVIAQQLVWRDVPIMIGASLLTWLLAADSLISRLDGLLLVSLLAGYLVFAILQSRREGDEVRQTYQRQFGNGRRQAARIGLRLLMIAAGLGLLLLGARWLVSSAVELASWIGVGELVVGLTVVALGTSAPEVATSIVATLKGERDIAIGNIVGSNLFNILGILGLTAVISSSGVPVARSALTFDIPVMLAVAIACLPIFFTGHLLARWEGALFLGYYVFYTSYLVMTATKHEATDMLTATLWFFIIPLTVITLVVATLRGWRSNDRGQQ